MHTEKHIAAAAMQFAERWAGQGYEKGDYQVFWAELLAEVYGVENPSTSYGGAGVALLPNARSPAYRAVCAPHHGQRH